MDSNQPRSEPRKQRRFLGSRASFVLLAFLGMIGYLLTTEHRGHVILALPWLFVLACPLMHVFMHGGHGHHHDRDGGKQ